VSAVSEYLEYKETIKKEAARGAAGVASDLIGSPFQLGKETVEKGLPGALKTVGYGTLGTAMLAAPAMALAAGWEAGGDIWDKALGAWDRVRGYQKMMKANPELEEQDETKVRSAYSTLHRFNPEMAGDPFVSGSFVKQVSEYDVIPTKTVGDLISARARVDKPRIMDRAQQFMTPAMQLARVEEARRAATEQQAFQLGLESIKADPARAQAQARAKAEGTFEAIPGHLRQISAKARAEVKGKLKITDPQSLRYQEDAAYAKGVGAQKAKRDYPEP
jgi:hypothetical protein